MSVWWYSLYIILCATCEKSFSLAWSTPSLSLTLYWLSTLRGSRHCMAQLSHSARALSSSRGVTTFCLWLLTSPQWQWARCLLWGKCHTPCVQMRKQAHKDYNVCPNPPNQLDYKSTFHYTTYMLGHAKHFPFPLTKDLQTLHQGYHQESGGGLLWLRPCNQWVT